MQILIDVARSSDGRLAGTVRPADSASEGRRFDGVMELIACLEQLCSTAPQYSTPSESDRGSCSPAPPAPTASQQLSKEGNQPG